MKKLLLSAVLCAFTLSNLYAQTKTYGTTTKSIQNTKIINQVPATSTPPPPPPPATKTNAPSSSSGTNTIQNDNAYYLTSARVNVRTGSDNKESPSQVYFQLSNGVGFIMQQRGENMRNEMKINSNTEFGLEKIGDPKSAGFTLESMKKKGFELRIVYFPDFIANAWKIEGVSITLEFTDQSGAPHPIYGSKTIIFNNANGFLDTFNKTLLCKADEQFRPLTSSIQP